MQGEPVYVLDYLQSAKAYKELLEKLVIEGRQTNNWIPYYSLQEFYADLRPAYALTIHQSQGSTFENVMVDFQDIYNKRHSNLSEADKCYYVAVTRAQKNVVILG
jgi:ATP-dependent exoDNAse (exonuclease V) alpha subunit